MVPLEGQPEPIEQEAEFQEQKYQRICQLLDRIPSEQAEVIRLRYYGDKSFRGLRPCAPTDSLPHRVRSGGGSIQAHVPLQCLGSVQMEALRPPLRTRQPPKPASLRLHRLRRHQHLHLRLRPMRQDRHAESHLQPSELETHVGFAFLTRDSAKRTSSMALAALSFLKCLNKFCILLGLHYL